MSEPKLPDEPDFGPWRAMPIEDLTLDLVEVASPLRRSVGVIAVDGHSASGKTTLATALAANLLGCAIVHTDDVAWHHSFFDWASLLIDHVLEPAGRGVAVAYRPDAWKDRGRDGAIHVESSTEWLIIEGVGAARRELAPYLDAAVWVTSDPIVARTRGIARDGGDAAAQAFWDEWMAEEVPFQAEHQPWERAAFVVNGTSRPQLDGHVLVTEPPRDR
ncbi:MAG: hypothetical protein QNJ88_08275 [Acidimicrobiia bacterium]|nr:hypothetical protein [Acidimicrobiia bacterium]